MLNRVKRDKVVYAMSPNNTPVLKVNSSDEIVFETHDCFTGQIESDDTKFDSLDWDNINPATGPVYINDAEPGDTLVVKILNITVGNRAAMLTGPDLGVMGSVLKENYISVLPVNNGFVEFSDKIKIPVKPMIGVIGVAPSHESINCGTPGTHGGNMDCKEIIEGATLMLPVNVKGALLSIGDLHAVMGDGEVCVCGAEVSGEVTVRINVIKGKTMPIPMIINNNSVMFIASEPTLDEAAEKATLNCVNFLINMVGFTEEKSISLLSLVGDVRICQMVDPLKTVRLELPITYIETDSFSVSDLLSYVNGK